MKYHMYEEGSSSPKNRKGIWLKRHPFLLISSLIFWTVLSLIYENVYKQAANRLDMRPSPLWTAHNEPAKQQQLLVS